MRKAGRREPSRATRCILQAPCKEEDRWGPVLHRFAFFLGASGADGKATVPGPAGGGGGEALPARTNQAGRRPQSGQGVLFPCAHCARESPSPIAPSLCPLQPAMSLSD
jgi:hypothetical protein